MKRLLTAVLFAATLAGAQEYTYTFTAPAGAITCQHWSSNVTFNQHFNVSECSVFPGFVSPDNLYTAAYEIGQVIQWLYINGAASQAVETDSGVWVVPPDPGPGVPATYTFSAAITNVCNAECRAATGDLTMTGDFAYQWEYVRTGPGCRVGCSAWIKVFHNTGPVVITGQSTVAILDEDFQKRKQTKLAMRVRWPLWNRNVAFVTINGLAYEQSWATLPQ